MVAILILIAVLLLLNVVVIILYAHLVKRLPPSGDEVNYYDENGNHIYYDRKLIQQLEQETKTNGSMTHNH